MAGEDGGLMVRRDGDMREWGRNERREGRRGVWREGRVIEEMRREGERRDGGRWEILQQ